MDGGRGKRRHKLRHFSTTILEAKTRSVRITLANTTLESAQIFKDQSYDEKDA